MEFCFDFLTYIFIYINATLVADLYHFIMNKEFVEKIGKLDGFFHRLTGFFAKDITCGTKQVDEIVESSLFRLNRSLEMKNPFPTLVETQGNVFEYEDFPVSRIDSELSDATSKLINSRISNKACYVESGRSV